MPPLASELWLATAPQAQAASLIADRVVLTPNPRAARALGVPYRSLESVAQGWVRHARLRPVDALTRMRLLHEAARLLDAPDPAGLARRMDPLVSELLRAGLELEALARHPEPRVQRAAAFTQAYQRVLRAAGARDAAETCWLALPEPLARQQVLVTGYPRLGRDEEAFLLALAAPGSVLVLPTGEGDAFAEHEELAARFAAAGWGVSRATMPLPPQERRAWQFADEEAEVRGVLAHVKELLTQGVSPAEVVLVARDDAAYGPMVLAIAHEQGLPVHASYQLPLARTRTGHWLGLLAEVIEQDLPFEATFRLLSHPLCRVLDGPTRARARSQHPRGVEAWGELGAPVDELSWPAAASRAAWLDRLLGLVGRLGLARWAQRWAAEAIAVGRARQALARLAEEPGPVLSRSAFLAELRELLNLLTTPAHPGRGGVALHTPLALFGARVPHVFVLGAAADRLPARLADDPVLDFTTRNRLAAAGFPLETAIQAARRERLTLESLLLVATRTLTFAMPRLAGGKPQLPSPLFGWLGLGLETPEVPVASLEAGRRLKLFGPGPDADPVLATARRALEIERRREGPGLIGALDPHDGYTGVPVDWPARTFSASQLSTLGQCAFRWFAEKILRLAEPDEGSDEVLPEVRGLLYHKTLELACRATSGALDLRAAVLAGLEATEREAERALIPELGYDLAGLPGWEGRRAEYLVALERAIAHAGFLDPDARVAGTELDFTGTWRGFALRGQVDRVDRVGDELVILDYKAGSAIYGKAQDAERKATVDLQLPIYMETAAPALFPGVPVREAAYYTLSKPKRHPTRLDPEALDHLVVRLRGYLEAGHFPVAPDLKRSACTWCELGPVCRAGARLGRKES